MTFSSLLLLPILACAAQTDAAPEPEPAVAAAPAEAGATNGPTNGATATAFVVPETEAGRVLAAAMADARGTDRLLFVHSGADW